MIDGIVFFMGPPTADKNRTRTVSKASALISEIVESSFDPHVYSSGNNGVGQELKQKFNDSAYWNELAEKHLPAFNLPAWNTPCTPGQMAIWLERLDFTEKQYQKHTNTSLKEFIELNPTWPLRAFIGTILEWRMTPLFLPELRHPNES